MIKKIIFLIFFLLCSPVANAKLDVVATTQDLADIAGRVGGDEITVTSLLKGNRDPHYLEPKPSYAVLMNGADLLILVGLDLEVGWLPVLLQQARNPKILKGNPGYLDASNAISPLEVPGGGVDRAQGDIHPYGNPHYWLNPMNGLKISLLIADRLSRLDPEHAQTYQQNQKTFAGQLKTKSAGWNQQIKKLSSMKVVMHHKTFSYFADWAGIMVANDIEPKPGIPPSPAHLAKLLQQIKDEKVDLIISASHADPKPGKKLQAETGVPHVMVPPSVGTMGVESYFQLFDAIIKIMGEKQ